MGGILVIIYEHMLLTETHTDSPSQFIVIPLGHLPAPHKVIKVNNVKRVVLDVNSLRPSDAYMRQ